MAVSIECEYWESEMKCTCFVNGKESPCPYCKGIKHLTTDEAFDVLKERGWCYQHVHPYSGAYDYILVGPRLPSENYGPAPEGFVLTRLGHGDTVREAVENALAWEKFHG